MRLHLLGLPHTITREEFSHCAFTGKVLKFSPMMRAQGFEVIHYGVGGMDSGATEDVVMMTEDEQQALIGHAYDPSGAGFVGDVAHTDHPMYRLFNERLAERLAERVEPGDMVCLPFGHGHQAGTRRHQGINVETGIGYPTCIERFRIYESNAWLHWHLGREQRNGFDYEWVIPNYFDVEAWDLQPEPGGYLLFFGRISAIKGLDIVVEIARRRPDLPVVLCGQGDPEPYLVAPNIEYRPPIFGRARSALLGNALAVLMPTRYVEPFGGVAVEAQLCGTPVLGSTFGAFTETIEQGVTGFRCHTLGDWLAAIDAAPLLDRTAIHAHARSRYSYAAVGPRYTAAFEQLHDLWGEGWYSPRSSIRLPGEL
jgi:glycosyltransferase involved in cell wall biosynthesis